MIIFGLEAWRFFVVLAASVYIVGFIMVKLMSWHTDRL